MSFALGVKTIADPANPQLDEIDLEFMWNRMDSIIRFSGAVGAFSLTKHMALVADLAKESGESPAVVHWAAHHDCHEYATGDIPTPIKDLLGPNIKKLELAWDRAIAGALGVRPPTDETYRRVKIYDFQALQYEWSRGLHRLPTEKIPLLPRAQIPVLW